MKASHAKPFLVYGIIMLVVGAIVATSVFAARVDRRQMRQGARIRQGVRSGQLTGREAAGLRAQQGHIRRLENRAEADGVVTPQEKQRLEKAQDRASKNIYIQKHDAQTQGQ